MTFVTNGNSYAIDKSEKTSKDVKLLRCFICLSIRKQLNTLRKQLIATFLLTIHILFATFMKLSSILHKCIEKVGLAR